EGALGHPADGEVPPDERLSQAGRQEPRRRCAPAPQARPDRAPPRRRRTQRAVEEPKSKTSPDRQAPFAWATRITAPTIVVGTYPTACIEIATRSTSSPPTPNT